METDSLELTNQGSFPLVFEVVLILHLIFIYFILFFATRQILIQKFQRGDGWIRNVVFGIGGKNRELTLGWKEHCMLLHPCFNPLGQPCHLATPPSASQALLPGPPPLSPWQPPGPLLRTCLPFPRLLWHPFLLFILTNWRPTPAAPQYAPPPQEILRKVRPAQSQPQPPGGEGVGPAPLPLPQRSLFERR